MPRHFAAFAGISLLLAILPGPDFALVTRNSLGFGRRGAIATALGLAGGVCLWILASAAGIVALLKAAPALYTVLRLCGGLYLGYLGAVSWLSSWRGDDETASPPTSKQQSIWLQGFASASLNPKLGVFFVALFPGFVDKNGSVPFQILILGVTFLVIGISWMLVVGLFIARLRDWITSPTVRAWLHRVTGTALLIFGAILIFGAQQ